MNQTFGSPPAQLQPISSVASADLQQSSALLPPEKTDILFIFNFR